MNLSQLKQLSINWLYSEGDYRIRPPRFELASVLSTPDASRVWGVDISHWNKPPVNLARMRDIYGMRFVIIKGCDGSLNTNYYNDHKAAAKAAGLPWGCYVWLYPNNRVAISAQVAAWWNRLKDDYPPLGVLVDAEWTTYAGKPANPTTADLKMACDQFEIISGGRRLNYDNRQVYTAAGYADQYLKGFDWSTCNLWVAHYGVNNPLLPSGATTYTFWQFTSTLDGKALDPNGNAELDGNYFNGTPAQFAARFGGIPQTEQPGGTVTYYQATGIINIRTGGAQTFPQVASGELYVLPGDVIEAPSAPVNGFVRFTKLYRDNVSKLLAPVTWCGTQWLVQTPYTPPVETPAYSIHATIPITLVIDGVTYEGVAENIELTKKA